jgi:hypothetical protein
VDAHAHLYAGVPLPEALTAAAANFRAGARALGLAEPGPGILLLAETGRTRSFDDLSTLAAERHRAAGWTLRPARERCSVLAEGNDGTVVVLVAGRQTVTEEGLELLLLGARTPVRPGTRLETLLEEAPRNVLAVLPWGLGKWWFRRGREARRALLCGARPAFAGDTVHRPDSGPEPRLLRQARRRGIPVLPGSDPLPVAGGHRALGGYGFVHAGGLSLSRPGAAVIGFLLETRQQPDVFGRPAGVGSFLRGQAILNFRKRLGPRVP